ncbi:unnamed protein product [Rhizoctonia solani]|uniref:DUF4139 domain-containing protein n=1 Tax=Rhizoctonia solani TaxID=456999 RepID=A0A8H2XDE1_9AGAM|nr:unnamed protein product [Rhizoctonia solani]
MDRTTSQNSSSCRLPIELTTLIVDFLQGQTSDLATAALASRTFYFAAVPQLYTHISFLHISKGSRTKWVKTVALWARTLNSSKHLASLVETLDLHVPECDLPVLYRHILGALLACVNLRELEIWHASHNTPVSWLFPEKPTFALHKLVSYIPASTGMARILESQPSIRTLRLETFTLRLPIGRGSLPYLTHYAGPSKMIVQARAQGDIWEHLVHAELQDSYRPMTGMLDAMPRLKSLDIVVAAWSRDAFQEIAQKCKDLRGLTIRDANGLFHSWQDGRLIRFATTPSFTAGLSAFDHLSSLAINAPYPLYHGRAPASTEKAQLVAWHAHCPNLRHFTSPTGLEWIFVPDSAGSSSADSGPAGQWFVMGGTDTLSQSNGTFATDPGMFGMRRAGNMRERSTDVDVDVDELIAIIERQISNRAGIKRRVNLNLKEPDAQITNTQGELNEARRKEFESARGIKRGTAITVTALAETDGAAGLMLTYGVLSFRKQAELHSDVRASTANTPEGSSTIALRYRASITQTTGENWPDVGLALSNASPQLTPSDEGSDKVVVAVLELEADLEWIYISREKESVLLTCKVANYSEFTLLPGEASVFMDNDLVSRGQVEHVSPNESFKISLGVDSALSIAYQTAKTLNRAILQHSFPPMANENQLVSAHSQKIMIRNSRSWPVSIRVLDHVPVSTDARLKVDVINPSGLDTAAAPTTFSSNGSDSDKREEYRGTIFRKAARGDGRLWKLDKKLQLSGAATFRPPTTQQWN